MAVRIAMCKESWNKVESVVLKCPEPIVTKTNNQMWSCNSESFFHFYSEVPKHWPNLYIKILKACLKKRSVFCFITTNNINLR